MVWSDIVTLEDDAIESISSISDDNGDIMIDDVDDDGDKTRPTSTSTSTRDFEFGRAGMLQMTDCSQAPADVISENDYKVRFVGWRPLLKKNAETAHVVFVYAGVGTTRMCIALIFQTGVSDDMAHSISGAVLLQVRLFRRVLQVCDRGLLLKESVHQLLHVGMHAERHAKLRTP